MLLKVLHKSSHGELEKILPESIHKWGFKLRSYRGYSQHNYRAKIKIAEQGLFWETSILVLKIPSANFGCFSRMWVRFFRFQIIIFYLARDQTFSTIPYLSYLRLKKLYFLLSKCCKVHRRIRNGSSINVVSMQLTQVIFFTLIRIVLKIWGKSWL